MVALRPLSSFWKAQYVQVFPLKPAPFCKLSTGLGSTNNSATFLLFLSDSRHSVFLSVFLEISNTLSDLAGTVFLSSCSIRLQQVAGHSFLSGNNAADELARRGALLVPSEILYSFSSFISCIHSSLFSYRRRTVSSKFFETQVPSISTEQLALLVTLAKPFLVYASTEQPTVKLLSL